MSLIRAEWAGGFVCFQFSIISVHYVLTDEILVIQQLYIRSFNTQNRPYDSTVGLMASSQYLTKV